MKNRNLSICFVLAAILLALPTAAAELVSHDFDDGSTHGWIAVGADSPGLVLQAPGPSGAASDLHLVFEDRSNADPNESLRLFAPPEITGGLRGAAVSCGALELDFRVLEDGGNQVLFDLVLDDDPDGNGAGAPPTVRARFRLHQTVDELDGWVHVVVPLALLDDGALPSNADGAWQMAEGSTPAQWNDLLASADFAWLPLDYSGTSERFGVDNVRLVTGQCPCGTGFPDHVIRGGLRDDFAPPTDPALPRPALQALIPAGTAVGFDDPRPNFQVGHTLQLPKKLAFLPTQIVRAELETRMSPNAGLADNDSLAFGVDADGTFTFSTLIEDLPETQGSWSLGDPAAVFRLDLGALPDGSDLLPKIDAERLLDVRVQDDTTVDYVQVALWTCPRPLVIDGSSTNPTLDTDTFPLPDGAVRFRPQVEGDPFGFVIEVGGAQGVCAAVSSHCPAGGAVGDLLATVLVEDIFNQDHELRFVQAAGGIALEVDPPPFGLHIVKAGLSGEKGDEILAEKRTDQGGEVALLPADACVRELDWVEPDCHRVWLTEPVPVTLLPGGPTVTADVVHVCGDLFGGVGVGIERFSVELTGAESLDLEGVALQQLGLFSVALGAARLEANGDALLVRNLGDGGDDGVSVMLPGVESVDFALAPLEVGVPLPVGAFLEARAQGTFEGDPEQPLGTLRVEKTGADEDLLVTADFAEVGSPTQRVQVLSGGAIVADLPGHLGPVGRVSEWPIGIGKLFPIDRTKCYAGDFPPDTLFSIDGVEVVGDELRVLADGADGAVGSISSFSLRTAGIPELTLTGAATEEATCLPDATTHCLADGRFEVTVDWQDFQGGSGVGQALPLTADTGMFWFFHPANIELVVKVLDARAVNGHFWVFYGALSNVGYTIHVRDTATGATRDYLNPSGSFGSRGDTAAFPEGGATGASVVRGEDLAEVWGSDEGFAGGWRVLQVPDEPGRAAAANGTCVADATSFCLHDGRFRISSEWQAPQGTSGSGQSIPLTSDTGAFWFFDAANVELVVKIIDGRTVNGHWWVFYGSLSNVAFQVVVDDLERDRRLTLSNPQGNFASRGETELLPAP